jgi:hypothetical protein
MRNISIPIFVFALLLIEIASLGAYKQDDEFLPGYIVMSKGDTIQGYILVKDHFSNTHSCTFKTLNSEDSREYSPGELMSYGVKGKAYFVSAEVSTGDSMVKIFLDCIVSGDVSLFYVQNRYFIESQKKIEELTITKRDVKQGDKIYNVEVESYKGLLQESMKECKDIFKYLEKTKLNKKDLSELFIAYNICTKHPYKEFSNDENKVKLSVGLSAGYVASGLKLNSSLDSYSYINGMNSFSPSLSTSFILKVSNIDIKDRFSFQTGIVLTFNNNRIYDEKKTSNLVYDLNIESIRIEIPFTVAYDIVKGRRGSTYFFLGFGLNSFIKWDETLSIKILSTSFLLDEKSELENNPFFFSMMGGLGQRFNTPRGAIILELGYNWSQILVTKEKPHSAYLNNISLSAGILF